MTSATDAQHVGELLLKKLAAKRRVERWMMDEGARGNLVMADQSPHWAVYRAADGDLNEALLAIPYEEPT